MYQLLSCTKTTYNNKLHVKKLKTFAQIVVINIPFFIEEQTTH